MASAATDIGFTSHIPEDDWRVEGHVTKVHQIGFGPADRLGMKHFSRLIQGIFIQLSPGRQKRLPTLKRKGNGSPDRQSCADDGHIQQSEQHFSSLTSTGFEPVRSSLDLGQTI